MQGWCWPRRCTSSAMCAVRAQLGTQQRAGNVYCSTSLECLLLHLSGGWRDSAGKGHESCYADLKSLSPVLISGSCSPGVSGTALSRNHRLPCGPAVPHWCLGYQTKQGEGTLQLQVTSRKRGISVIGLGHTVSKRRCRAWRREDIDSKILESFGF